jgi:hypothetical protein
VERVVGYVERMVGWTERSAWDLERAFGWLSGLDFWRRLF